MNRRGLDESRIQLSPARCTWYGHSERDRLRASRRGLQIWLVSAQVEVGRAGRTRMHTSTTHTTLLARVATGADPAAWREFAERYGPLIRSFAARRGVQPSDCDDVVQDTLLALTRSMPTFQYDPARGKFRSYLKTIVIHAIFRRNHQKNAGAALEDIERAASTAAQDDGVEALWDDEWRQYHLQRAMKQIDVEFNTADRAAFKAYAIDGRDARETADSLGLSVDQVYHAKSRILKRLGQQIAAQVEEEG